MGRGGELAHFPRDLPEAVVRFRSPADVVSVRLPLAPFGYQAQATGDALTAAARLVAERDAEIALLRRELRRLDPDDPGGLAGSGGSGGLAGSGGSGGLADRSGFDRDDPDEPVPAGTETGEGAAAEADPQQRQP
jgi:hypothetical protein